ncbi:hypothetical protein ACWDFR_38405 [Streptomyces sp. 900105755]|uniref:hypothetical protein n=1 Tax=Streptomyces sp. NPDC001507 TaxID=3364579 RepID=UPI0036C675FF
MNETNAAFPDVDPSTAPVQDGRHRAAAPPVSRTRRLFLGAPEDPRWARPALWAVLLLATALYAWNLTSITGNSFYDAAVYSGTRSDFLFHIRRGMLEFVGFQVLDPVVTHAPARMTGQERTAALDAVAESVARLAKQHPSPVR